jgi:ligand-binding sensor domain-containing protein
MKIGPALVLTFLLVSCNNQNTTQAQEITTATKNLGAGQPKLVRTQGTNQFAVLHCGIEDRNGNLWFGTTGEGVYRYDPSTKTFTNYTVKDGLSSNTVWCILKDQAGNLWFGTSNGICRYGSSNSFGTSEKTFSSITILTNFGPYFPSSGSSNTSKSSQKNVWCITQDKTGKFWFGTSDGIYQYDGLSFTHFLHDDGIINNTGLQTNSVENILEDKVGNIWFGGRGTEGVLRFDPRTKKLSGFTPDKKEWLRPLFEDNTGTLWFGTRNHSLYRYVPSDSTFSVFGEKEIDGWVVSVVEDKEGKIWFSSENGIVCYNPSAEPDRNGKQFTKYTTKEGLINRDVFSLTLDNSGNIWVGTRNIGLYRFDLAKKTFTNFSE